MLTVTHNGITEPLDKISGYELKEEVNGALTLSLTSFNVADNPGHALLQEEAVIEVEDGRTFRIKQLRSTRTQKQVTALSTFFDLGGVWKTDIFGGTKTLDAFLSWVFADTGWTYEIADVSGSKLVANFGNDNVLKLIETLLTAFECERQVMPGNHVRFAKQLGPDNDEQYRYGHNIKALSHSVDTTNLRTKIRGFGGNGLAVTYTSPNADKFPNAGEAEPFRDERFTVADSLIERIKQELTDYPEVSIELDALELTQKELGERVWLIYEPLGIEFQTRILEKTTRIPAERSSAVIGNAKRKTLSDQLTETNITIDENQKQTESKFEQTNDRISMEVERLDGDIVEARASFTIEADAIRAEVVANRTYVDEQLGEVREEASSNFDILAGQISASVQTSKEYTDSQLGEVRVENSSEFDILSGQIRAKADSSTVSSLGTRVTSVELNLNAVEGSISSKVSYTDYTGTTIASKINQSASSISISANAINLSGIVRVADSVELGYSGNGQTKAVKFNGFNAWIYSPGDFSLSLDASYVRVLGTLTTSHPAFNGYDLPVTVGYSSAQRLAIGIDGNYLNVYDSSGTRRRLQFI